jgi:hypothetical protein
MNNATHMLIPLVSGSIGPVFWRNAMMLAGGGALVRRASALRQCIIWFLGR